ncbi:MAG: hypothetical protein GWN50_12650 [Candidatus Dadabacteria bacterium]|nr:hypothetical protein [Candidatus Dadabacteria bacterium]
MPALLVTAMITMLVSGCAYSGARANRTVLKITPERIATPKLGNNVNFVIYPNAWRGEPRRLRNHITPFYVEIQNRTDNNVVITESDFVLFDEQRNQYNLISPGRAANIVKTAERKRYRIYPRISIGVDTSYHHDRFHYYGHHHYPFYRPYYFHDYLYPGYRRSYYEPDLENIYSRAITLGTLRPNATLSGYIYFNKIPQETRELTLELGYKEKESKTTHKLDFHFDILEVYYK